MRKRDLLFFSLLLIVAFTILFSSDRTDRVVKYDCRIAEISPDYPVKVKEACRRIREERNKSNE